MNTNLNFKNECDEMIQNVAVKLFGKMSEKSHCFEANDYVYCYVEDIGHMPCTVQEVKGNTLVLCDGNEVFEANASDCKSQDEE